MKILHTSDWHLGQKFMGQSRADEHKAFLSWAIKIIKEENIDVLIVAGDIFDTGNPPNYALELYYNFLKQLFSIKNLYVIITAGNHDSISTLKASKQLLEFMNVHVITSGEKHENELIPIYKEDKLQAVVCAVPFLRDSVVRKAISGQTTAQKESFLNTGIKQHYVDVYEEAVKLTSEDNLPIIATGHLTTVGARTSESERDIYIGGTLDIGSDFLAKYFDYVALGHLHINQIVGLNHVRYSGSVIPLSFSEANQKKKINIVEFKDKEVNIKEIEIPLYRKLQVIKGNLKKIQEELKALEIEENKNTWIEVHLKDENPMFANQEIRELSNKLNLILLAVKIEKNEKQLKAKELKVISLDELSPNDVFKRRLELEKLENKEFEDELNLNFKKVYDKVQAL